MKFKFTILVLLLVLSNAVQNSMNAGDNTVGAGLILVVTLVALNSFMGYLTWRNKRIEVLVEGKPQILVHNGQEVLPGAVIGRVGDAGSLKGPILHFEVRKGSAALNPESWLR